MKERENFASRLGFILVSAGCAVGLGNVWKFPYICGQNGGAAFILIYLVFLIILGLPVLICEFALGRGSGRGVSLAYDRLEQPGSVWHRFKWPNIAGNYLLMMFYTMVAGWMIAYAFAIAAGRMEGLNAEEVGAQFADFLQSPGTQIIWMLVAILLSMGVCAMGLQSGVERITKVMMTLLIMLMLVMAVHSLLLKGAGAGVRFYLVPDFGRLLEQGVGSVVFAAMTHAFFTLSIGIGAMTIFGSYLGRERTLAGEAVSIVGIDTLVALTAGIIIIPACFAYGVEPSSGPSLLFITLPNVFNHMLAGRIWGTMFFVFMSFAALSTVIAVFENIVSFYMDGLNWSRRKAVLVNLVLIALLSLPAVLGFSLWSGFQPLGEGTSVMDLEDFLVSYNLLPLGGMVFVLFCTHKNGWGWEGFRQEVNAGEGLKLSQAVRFYMTYILPLIITAVYLKGYYDMFAPKGQTTLIGWMIFVGWMIFAVLLLVMIFYFAMKRKKTE